MNSIDCALCYIVADIYEGKLSSFIALFNIVKYKVTALILKSRHLNVGIIIKISYYAGTS